MTKEEFIIHQYSLHLSAFYSKNSADTILQQGEHSRQAALEIATEDANFIERNHPELFEHVQYTIQAIAGNPIENIDPFFLEKNSHINEEKTNRALYHQLRRQKDRSAAGDTTPTAATNDTSADAQSFRDSITEISRQIVMPFVLMIDKYEGLQYEDEKAQTFIFQMEDDIKQIPSTGVYISDSVYAKRIAMGALWLLLQRHHTKDPIRNIPAFSMAIMNRIVNLLVKKNHDYGNSFGDQLAEDGPIVFKIRMKDKISRLRTLLTTEAQVKDESIEDTLRDIIGYCILFLHHTAN